jgi:hypothetical protein
VPIFDTAPAASKNEAHIKSGQNRPKINRLTTYNLNPRNSLYQHKIFGFPPTTLVSKAVKMYFIFLIGNLFFKTIYHVSGKTIVENVV